MYFFDYYILWTVYYFIGEFERICFLQWQLCKEIQMSEGENKSCLQYE